MRFDCQFAFCFQVEHPQRRDYCTLESDSDADLRVLIGRSAVNLLSVIVGSGVFRQALRTDVVVP